MIKNLPIMQETWVLSRGQEDLLEKRKATHPNILAWRIPWTEEPGALQSMGSLRVGHDWETNTHICDMEKLAINNFTVPLFLIFSNHVTDCTSKRVKKKEKYNIYLYNHPSGTSRVSVLGPMGYANLKIFISLIQNGIVFTYNLYIISRIL